MNHKQALKLAIECITGEHPSMKQYAVGANRYKMDRKSRSLRDGSRTAANTRDFEEYTRLAEAMRIIEDEILGQGRLF